MQNLSHWAAFMHDQLGGQRTAVCISAKHFTLKGKPGMDTTHHDLQVNIATTVVITLGKIHTLDHPSCVSCRSEISFVNTKVDVSNKRG